MHTHNGFRRISIETEHLGAFVSDIGNLETST